ncbi:MAG: DUF1501 domain-containing protein [Prosthecobacter sp.]|jgi:hypothetical protein|uniref:DUF1501 domain-containing protein n=1 Tax=Prosthecobacter sp. TaxID=1965333 RepID=UPI0019DCDD11|nr:DUF1501 domain-containing protein [Prosthecobacter sp.]MBE2285320.1 DUF1501 domain-containing protein [Prosthecobacter sp.]
MNTIFSRREMLTTMSSGVGWLAFAALAQGKSGLASKAAHFAPRAKRVIFLTMRGGPSHVDLFDYKPELAKRDGKRAALGRDSAGAKLFGAVHPFGRYGQSGQWMTTLYPHLARHADDLCIINSMHTDLPNHAQAFVQMHTGSFQFVRPSVGAWTLYGLGTENDNLPGFITLNPPADNGGAQNYGSAFLPAICQGTRIGGSQLPDLYAALLKKDVAPGPPMKNIENKVVSRDLQRAQIDLIRGLNERKMERDGAHPEIEGMIQSFELAFRMQSEVPEVLDLRGESEATLKLYGIGQGKDQFARQCLLARRLAEAGVRFIEIASGVQWDHHNRLREQLATNCAATDQPIAALLSDLKARGMLNDTLVVWAGEFGRTPYAQSGDGRDHNHKGYSIWMAGGGVKGGLRYGSTDEIGYKAAQNPMHIHDWHATILHLLGLDHTKLTYNHGGRNFRLTNVGGEVAPGILA